MMCHHGNDIYYTCIQVIIVSTVPWAILVIHSMVNCVKVSVCIVTTLWGKFWRDKILTNANELLGNWRVKYCPMLGNTDSTEE